MVGTIGDGVARTVLGHLATAGAHGAGATILRIIMDIMAMAIHTIRGAIVITIGMAVHITITITIITIMVGMADIITVVTPAVVRLA